MTFKELKPNFPAYIFHKGKDIRLVQGKVISVSNPRFQNSQTYTPYSSFSNTNAQVVDVTIEEDGVQKTYTTPDTLEVTYAGTDLAIGTSVDAIIREVEAVKSKADEAIASVDRNKEISDKCMCILSDWNPVFKTKKENDERFNNLESKMSEMSEMVKNLIDKLK